MARCWFSNWPPSSRKVPGGSSFSNGLEPLLHLGDEAAQVAAADVGLDDHAPDAVLAGDLGRRLDELGCWRAGRAARARRPARPPGAARSRSMSSRLSGGKRTTTAKRRWSSMSVVAALPAMADSMVSLTSPTAMPWRAAASRSMTTSYWVRPETCSTFTSVAPRHAAHRHGDAVGEALEERQVGAEDLHGQVALHARR